LCRALSEMYARPVLGDGLAFRGGTALHKLFFDPPGRYSEDLDLVQVTAGPIKPILLEVQLALDHWLDAPRLQQTKNGVKLFYGYESTAQPVRPMRVKIEINTREHFAHEGFHRVPFVVDSRWYTANVALTTYSLEELLATKLRALYQRKKGRDLYDLWLALDTMAPDAERVAVCFRAYLAHGGLSVSRAEYEANMAQKLDSSEFRIDVEPLLRDASAYDIDSAYALVHAHLIARLPGQPWKGSP